MKYQISGQELQKALEVIAEVTKKSLKKAESVLDRPSDEDLLFYDNVSMMDKLKVSERTLQRRRKNGEIRFIRFGGKIYYPKNFMVLPVLEPEVPEYEKDNAIPLNEFIKRYNTPRPRSRIIDVDRLAAACAESRVRQQASYRCRYHRPWYSLDVSWYSIRF
jgi:hypothetical protein